MFERGGPPPTENLVTVDSNTYDALLGRTWAEIGSEARSMHKCQGFGQLLALPGPFVVKYKLAETTIDGHVLLRRPGDYWVVLPGQAYAVRSLEGLVVLRAHVFSRR